MNLRPARNAFCSALGDVNATQTCPFCLQLYPYEVEYRCVQCDEPVCPFCIVEVKLEQRCCPSCAVSELEAEHGGAGDLEG